MESSTLFAPAGGEPFGMLPATAEQVTAAFLAQCEADGRAETIRQEATRHGATPPYMGYVLAVLGLESLLEEAGSDEQTDRESEGGSHE